MPTAEQQSLIDDLNSWIETHPSVEALWLAGSLGKGQGDAYSDVDLLLLVAVGKVTEISAVLAEGLDQVTRPVLVNKLYGGRVVNVVTEEWGRFDLSLIEPADLARYNAADLMVLFNRSGLAPPVRPETPYQTPPDTLLKIVQEFLRVLGMLPGALGRQEYELSLRGVDLLRGITMDLMLEENGVSPAMRGGALRRRPFLNEAQLRDLATIPPQAAEPQSAIDASLAIAAIFLPRARRLAAKIGMVWPQPLESAARRRLKLALGLDLPPAPGEGEQSA